MAGKYSRFRNEGYKLPKYLLPWGNRSILSEILHQLLQPTIFDQVFLVANKADNDFMSHVKKIMKHYGIDSKHLILLPDTEGQAHTAFMGLTEIEKTNKLSGPVVFHNIDTILYGRDLLNLKKSLYQYDGHIDVFKSNSHEYSYVLVNNDTVSSISEKILISDLATSGLYGFSSSQLFTTNFSGENYISEIYKKIISKDAKICVGKTHDEKNTIVLGTPNEYLRCSKTILD